MNLARFNFAGLYNFFHFNDGNFSSRCSHWIKVHGGVAINTIAKTDIDALIQSVVSHAKTLMNARQISIDVTQMLHVETPLALMTVPVELVTKVNLSMYTEIKVLSNQF